MSELVTEARALCEGATKGPWTLIKEGRYEDHDECRIDLPDDNIELCRYENGELVARSRTLLPEMAAEIERLERERDRFKARAEAAEAAEQDKQAEQDGQAERAERVEQDSQADAAGEVNRDDANA